MTEYGDLRRQINTIFVETLNLDVPSEDTDVIETGILDSLALVDLLVCLERQFSTQILTIDTEIDNFRTITKIAAFVASKIEQAAVAWDRASALPLKHH